LILGRMLRLFTCPTAVSEVDFLAG
jgi:hypothetical protein